MSSYSFPSGNVKACPSQKERRNTLFHATRSASRRGSRVMWVRGREAVSQRYCHACCRPCPVSRHTLPVTRSEPVDSSEATIRSYASWTTKSSLSANAR
ncbi:hypothetical protein SVIOM74S_02478 [Streptomyces violarus]